jgi:hypothetical protein
LRPARCLSGADRPDRASRHAWIACSRLLTDCFCCPFDPFLTVADSRFREPNYGLLLSEVRSAVQDSLRTGRSTSRPQASTR